MSTITTTMIRDQLPSPSVHRFSVDEHERIIPAGELTDPGRVELVNGYMVDKTAKTTQHGYSTRKVLDGTVGGRLRVGYWRVATLLNLVMSPDLLVAG